jgi:hypothetical protein
MAVHPDWVRLIEEPHGAKPTSAKGEASVERELLAGLTGGD